MGVWECECGCVKVWECELVCHASLWLCSMSVRVASMWMCECAWLWGCQDRCECNYCGSECSLHAHVRVLSIFEWWDRVNARVSSVFLWLCMRERRVWVWVSECVCCSHCGLLELMHWFESCSEVRKRTASLFRYVMWREVFHVKTKRWEWRLQKKFSHKSEQQEIFRSHTSPTHPYFCACRIFWILRGRIFF